MKSPKLIYEIGDPCWIFAGEADASGYPALEGGRVIYWFMVDGHPNKFYVIRLDDPEFNHFEVRDAFLMTDAANGMLPWARGGIEK